MTKRGFEPTDTIQATCDQGDDINANFILPDGTVVLCDFREDPETRQAVSVTSWCISGARSTEEDMYSLAVEVLRDLRLKDAFDRAVVAYYDFHLRDSDRPLPVSG